MTPTVPGSKALNHSRKDSAAMDASCPEKSVANGASIRSTMGDHHNSIDTQEGCSTLLRVVHVSAKGAYGVGNSPCAWGPFEGAEEPFQAVAQDFIKTFGRLEHNIPHEAVTHNDVGATIEDVVAFNIANKVYL
jgi:hypothetical protein